MKNKYIISCDDEINVWNDIGGKAAALLRLQGFKAKIPEWFVIQTDAFLNSLSEEEKKIWEEGQYEKIKEIIPKITINDDVLSEIKQGLKNIGAATYAVRSSAMDEDSNEKSFAGQYETFLNVTEDNISEAVKNCWLSGFSERVTYYTDDVETKHRLAIPSVIIQRMLQPESAGVAFAIDPVTIDFRTTIVSAVYGLGNSLVDGSVDADTYYVVDGKNIEKKSIADKKQYSVNNTSKDGSDLKEVPESLRHKAVLSDEQILVVANLVQSTSRYFGRYQDIEWAIQDGELYLLQSRAITTLKDSIPGKEKTHVFDNSNASENYNGITLPLTYSLARRSCELAMRTASEQSGISIDWILENISTYRTLYGYVNGQLLMGLKAWYKMLETIPGKGNNDEYMELMMGLDENITVEQMQMEKNNSVSPGSGLKQIAMVLKRYLGWKKIVKRYYEKMDSDLLVKDYKFSTLYDLEKAHTTIVEQMGRASYVEILNDTLTMIFDGMLRKICNAWFGNEEFRNQVLINQNNIVSVEPVILMKNMSEIVGKSDAMTDLFMGGNVNEIENAIKENIELSQMMEQYLGKFGDRCIDELKLEAETIHDNPLLLYRNIGQYAKNKMPKSVHVSYEEVIKRIKPAFSGKIFRWLQFKYLAKKVREHVAYRENFRFQRTRMFAAERRIFREIALRFCSMQILEDKNDIYYLEIDEIIRFMNGTASTYDLKELVKIRRNEFERYKEESEITHVAFHGSVGGTKGIYQQEKNVTFDPSQSEVVLDGLACCSGRVEGRARVVLNPLEDEFEEGDILIAKHTDPGWILVIGRASAVVIENGSMLSHAAIVTREMGIPSVVSVNAATTTIHNNDWICVDGTLGQVVIKKK